MLVHGNVYKLSREEFRNRLQGATVAYDASMNEDEKRRLDNQYKVLALTLISENLKVGHSDARKVFDYCEANQLAVMDVLERRVPLLRILQQGT